MMRFLRSPLPRPDLSSLLLLLSFVPGLQAAAPPPSLQETFANHFVVGTAINRSQATGTAGRRSADQVAQDIALVKRQFNQVTAENDMKWQLIHPREGSEGYDFGPADTFVNF